MIADPAVADPPIPVESSATIQPAIWGAAVCAAIAIIGCLIACFVLMSWMCCVG
ncbi:MAG TPA: hypothetical protein VH302_13400 [Bryobacteraceae bacterium]|nr:hypothetical protein [Bryobacteraceae bacterium]